MENKLKKWFRSNILSEYLLIILIVLVLFIGVSYFNEREKTTHESNSISTFDLPLKYFTDDSIAWGSVDTSRDSSNKNTWEYATVDVGYHSIPSTHITLSKNSFSNDDRLTNQRSLETLLDESVVEKFDIDNDGEDEEILYVCSGGNHCPHEIAIVKDEKIIFSVSAGLGGLDLTDTKTGNGFYVHWVPTDGKWDERGLCCPLGYMKTRFVYKDEKFAPVYEQEVLYVQINNTE